MARPIRDGLEYFPLNTDFEEDDKVAIIEAQYGIIGHSLLVRLLCRIYKNGYFYQWTEKEQLLLAKRINVDINEVSNIINDSVKWGFFDADLFNTYKILTSVGIQKRYFEATLRRQEVKAFKPYMLLGLNDLKKYKNLVLVDENGNSEKVYVNNNPSSKNNNANKNAQSKEKESKEKEKESKENESKSYPFMQDAEATQKIIAFWDINGFGFDNTYAKNKLTSWLDEPSFQEAGDMILFALEIASGNNKRNINYVEGILKRWVQDSCHTLSDAKSQQEEFKRQSQGQGSFQKRTPMQQTPINREEYDLND